MGHAAVPEFGKLEGLSLPNSMRRGKRPLTARMVAVWFEIAQIGLIGTFLALDIPRAFSDGIRPGNAVRPQLRGKLMHY